MHLIRTAASVLVVGALVACSDQPTSPAEQSPQFSMAGVSASATGSGIIAPGVRTFTFQANTLASGETKGNAQLTFPGQNLKLHMTLDCLEVVGNQATMSGYVKNVQNNPNYEAGDAVWFRVVDNGEPSVDDQITFVTIYFNPAGPPAPGASCTEEGAFPGLNTIQSGNVQVH